MWEDNVRRVVPYTPGEQPKIDGLIKLNTNENPYPPAPAVSKALKEMDYDAWVEEISKANNKIIDEFEQFLKIEKCQKNRCL